MPNKPFLSAAFEATIKDTLLQYRIASLYSNPTKSAIALWLNRMGISTTSRIISFNGESSTNVHIDDTVSMVLQAY